MPTSKHPILNPEKRKHASGGFDGHEVRLALRNHGMQTEALRYDVTPAGMHYLLIHFDVPYVASADSWRVEICGLVDRALSLTVSELQQLPQQTHRVTMECAGNGRALYEARWQSQPWHNEAVGTAEWTGTPLKSVLARAGLKADAREVVFYGADRGFDTGVEHNYGRSLKVPMALSDDVLIVTAMNGQPLLPQHGFPVRLIVPGWYGMASVKWLNRIEVVDHAFQGHQQVGTYVYRQKEGEDGVPVTSIRVKSLMVPPGIPDWFTRGRVVTHGKNEIFGRAWSGNAARIVRVEFGVDGIWADATLDPEQGKFAWRGWRCNWDAAPGEHMLSCRATDEHGHTQPLEAPFDRAGFGNNEVQRVAVTVREAA